MTANVRFALNQMTFVNFQGVVLVLVWTDDASTIRFNLLSRLLGEC